MESEKIEQSLSMKKTSFSHGFKDKKTFLAQATDYYSHAERF